MRTIGYIPLHYGSEYLKESIQAILPLVEALYIMYSATPSHGSGTNAACPDSEADLKQICESLSNKIVWISGKWAHEGEQRNEIYKYSAGYDMLITVDSDEVVDTFEMYEAIESAYLSPERNFGVKGYINFFRSFNHICQDGYRPIRIINLHNSDGQGESEFTIYHFGCAQNRATMEYKYLVHGHKHELRHQWLHEIFYSDQTEDLHPVALGLWNLEPFDKKSLPARLKLHPNFSKDRI